MAEDFLDLNGASVNSFSGGMDNDISDTYSKSSDYIYARNAISNTANGDLGKLPNEPANAHCVSAPYTIIGFLYIKSGDWLIYSTDDVNSEIGRWDEDLCQYTTIVNDPCLAFKRSNLITGVVKERHDCDYQAYWSDGGLNPDRTMAIGDVPWIQSCVDESGIPNGPNGCLTCTDTDRLDCDAIRLAPLLQWPCISIKKGAAGGELLNGSYFVVISYLVNGQRITDYSSPSNIQPIFTHANIGGSLDIELDGLDVNFEEFELVLISTTNQETVARKVGVYSTNIRDISLDRVSNESPAIPVEFLPIMSPVYEKSDAMFSVNDYLLRTGPSEPFDFNYQPLANMIVSKWVSVEYPFDYYKKGGSNVGYMRDENYVFFIRFIDRFGRRTPSYLIPGRPPVPSDVTPVTGADAYYDTSTGYGNETWKVLNTASVTSVTPATLSDGGIVIAEGLMGYHETSERYDSRRPDIWNASSLPAGVIPVGQTPVDLCGKNIRLHRFPENATDSALRTNHYSSGGGNIRVMGVKFENIIAPVDNQGNAISGIVGYEILRGSRQGNKTIVAKGMLNNMRTYTKAVNNNRQGLFPNYPYNDTSNVVNDKFIKNTGVSFNHFTFHSPDTQFKNPYLSAKELKIYGSMFGTAFGRFVHPDKHPKAKFITDFAAITFALTGMGLALLSTVGRRTVRYKGGQGLDLGLAGTGSASNPALIVPNATSIGTMLATPSISSLYAQSVLDATTGTPTASTLFMSGQASSMVPLAGRISSTVDYEADTGAGYAPGPSVLIGNSARYADTLINAFLAISPYQQHALQFLSHGKYDSFVGPISGNRKRQLEDAVYLEAANQDYGALHSITNIFRSRAVALSTPNSNNQNILPTSVVDQSVNPAALYSISNYSEPQLNLNDCIVASHYVSLRQRLQNQYGQVIGVKQVVASNCIEPIQGTITNSGVIFGGDTYIGRFTEKNTMPLFADFMYDMPDGSEFNYKLRKYMPGVEYWANTEKYNAGALVQAFADPITGIATIISGSPVVPSQYHNMDGPGVNFFTLKDKYFYLFVSGVRDFFVESDVNIDLRDWGDNDSERHYDNQVYTDLEALFHPTIIKSGNYYKYDYSLSVSHLINDKISWGYVHPRDYNPTVAEYCYKYRPRRVIYSLQSNLEAKQDYWRIFLANNYKDFMSKVTSIKPINKTGAVFFLKSHHPMMFNGVDELQTNLGVKLTIGDGGLFSAPMQNLASADEYHEHGSCQSLRSVINTPAGLFWVSQYQGKIYRYAGQMKDMSAIKQKWWFAKFLPSRLMAQFPNYDMVDNPVVGVGVQCVYDNKNELLYVCKKDYELRSEFLENATYSGNNIFIINELEVELGDPYYFSDASWTYSFDPKKEEWLSFHDWHPDLTVGSRGTFHTSKESGVWEHNNRCDLFCNYYGVDFPFEVGFRASTPNDVRIVRSIEYYMECYRWGDNCHDRFHVLDENFDEMIVWNSEECSGLLRMINSHKESPMSRIMYPIYNPGHVDILFSKEEQKYRVNQFCDLTDDRGEFNPAAQRNIWITEPNGYVRNLNPVNIDYAKRQTERKKFRHTSNMVLLRKNICGNNNLVVNLANTKHLKSLR